MRICKLHWDMIRESVKAHGMGDLGAKSGESAVDAAVAELRGEGAPFDPNMSHNNWWWQQALRAGGLEMMEVDLEARPDNDGHYCPLCEFEKRAEGFVAQEQIDKTSKLMQKYCRDEGLIPNVQ